MSLQTKSKTSINLKKNFFLKNNKTDFNILLFLLLFVVLLQGFYLYIGITTPGGKYFSPFLNRYANFPDWFSILITKASKFCLQLAGYTVYQKKPSNISIVGGGGVNIAWGCLGAGAICLWIAFITAHKTNAAYKLKWIVPGIAIICVVNVARVITIALSYHYNWHYPKHFDAHNSFNILTYAIILLLMYVFVRRYNKKKEITAGSD